MSKELSREEMREARLQALEGGGSKAEAKGETKPKAAAQAKSEARTGATAPLSRRNSSGDADWRRTDHKPEEVPRRPGLHLPAAS